ncbi:MAG: hypothetical protein IPN69_20890 [Acidobacteria bacterium]|nr:hypothetical protein [Acidobacteriota bacterium]MBK8813165.1 hypothetical protein [Acidobacteriota bacterium]
MRLVDGEIDGLSTFRSAAQTVKFGDVPQFFGIVVVFASTKLRSDWPQN